MVDGIPIIIYSFYRLTLKCNKRGTNVQFMFINLSIFLCPNLIDLIPDPIPITLGVCDTQALF